MRIYETEKAKEIALKLVLTIIVIIAIFVFVKGYGYLQQDHLECEVVAIYPEKNVVVFSAYGDNLYEWETQDLSKFTVGETYNVDFFDFEDFNPYNNAIIKVHIDK